MKAALPSYALGLALVLAAWVAPHAGAQVPVPPFDALVVDLTGTLTAAQQAALDDKLTAFQQRKGAQIALLIVPTTQPEDIAQYGIRVAETWKVGRAAPDDGAILIVAKEDRALRIEVGRGLEGALTDATSSRIINDTIVPLFKQGDLYAGITAGLDQMIRVVDGEALPAPDAAWRKPNEPALPLPVLLFAAIAGVGVLSRIIGRGPAAALGGAGVGAATWWITASIGMALGFGLLFGVLALLGVFGAIGRRGYGGGFGGGGFGGGRGGGFGGGGGGSFGGGGASGRW